MNRLRRFDVKKSERQKNKKEIKNERAKEMFASS